jgi:hypothetical protein
MESLRTSVANNLVICNMITRFENEKAMFARLNCGDIAMCILKSLPQSLAWLSIFPPPFASALSGTLISFGFNFQKKMLEDRWIFPFQFFARPREGIDNESFLRFLGKIFSFKIWVDQRGVG